MRCATFVILWIGCLAVAATSIRGTWFPAPGPKPAPFSKRIRDQMKKDAARGSSSSGTKGKKGKKDKEDGEDEGAPWLFLALLVGAGIFATRDKLKAMLEGRTQSMGGGGQSSGNSTGGVTGGGGGGGGGGGAAGDDEARRARLARFGGGGAGGGEKSSYAEMMQQAGVDSGRVGRLGEAGGAAPRQRPAAAASREAKQTKQWGQVHTIGTTSDADANALGHSDATADDRARLVFPENDNKDE